MLERGGIDSTLEVPDTIHGLLMARIDRLADEAKRVLQTASVLGREFSARLLNAVCRDCGTLPPHLSELKRLEFLYERAGTEEPLYVFKHALTQDVAYESLLISRRQALHEATGRALEDLYPDRTEEYCEVLAHHYSRSANGDKAFEYLVLANQKAEKANAMLEAKGHFDEAMQLLDGLPDTEANQRRRISLLARQGWIMQPLLKVPEYYELLIRYEPLAIRVADQGVLGAFYAWLGHCQWWFGDYDRAIETDTKAAQLCEAGGNTEEAVHAYTNLAWSYYSRGDYPETLARIPHVSRALDRQFTLRSYVIFQTAVVLALSWLGQWDRAVEEAQKALRVAEEFSDNSMISFAAWAISLAYASRNDLTRAVEYGELGVQKAPTPGDQAWAQAVLALAWCRSGEPTKAAEALIPIVAMLRSVRMVWGETYTLFLGEAYWRAGRYDEARETLEECLGIVEARGMKCYAAYAHRLLGEIALSANPGQLAERVATPHFEKSVALSQEIGAENELALAYAGYGRLHKQLGRIAKARDYLTRALEIFERLGTLIEPDKVRQELATLPAR